MKGHIDRLGGSNKCEGSLLNVQGKDKRISEKKSRPAIAARTKTYISTYVRAFSREFGKVTESRGKKPDRSVYFFSSFRSRPS